MRQGLQIAKRQGRGPENGSVLIISLVMLVILAALATTALTTSTQEQRMSVNSQEQDIAFQAAESGLKAGEAIVEALPVVDYGTAGCTAPCIVPRDAVNNGIFANAATLPWGDFANHPEIGTVANYTTSTAAPEYVVEYIGFMRDPNSSIVSGGQVVIGSEFYRVTATGVGRLASATSGGGRAVLQSIYAKQF